MERKDQSDFGRHQPRSRSVSPDARSAEVSSVDLMSLLAARINIMMKHRRIFMIIVIISRFPACAGR